VFTKKLRGVCGKVTLDPLKGLRPWLRVGDYRVVYRQRESQIVVARMVSRQELELAIDKLKR